MRMAVAAPGNDFRLGCMEAPPAIVSTYLGESLTDYLKIFSERAKAGQDIDPYEPRSNEIDLGSGPMGKREVPAEDRNRTSPFPYGGHRFEFRAVGSSQNVSMVSSCPMSLAGVVVSCARLLRRCSNQAAQPSNPTKKKNKSLPCPLPPPCILPYPTLIPAPTPPSYRR